MGSNLPLFTPEGDTREETTQITTSTGAVVNVPTDKNIGTLGSGGLY